MFSIDFFASLAGTNPDQPTVENPSLEGVLVGSQFADLLAQVEDAVAVRVETVELPVDAPSEFLEVGVPVDLPIPTTSELSLPSSERAAVSEHEVSPQIVDSVAGEPIEESAPEIAPLVLLSEFAGAAPPANVNPQLIESQEPAVEKDGVSNVRENDVLTAPEKLSIREAVPTDAVQEYVPGDASVDGDVGAGQRTREPAASLLDDAPLQLDATLPLVSPSQVATDASSFDESIEITSNAVSEDPVVPSEITRNQTDEEAPKHGTDVVSNSVAPDTSKGVLEAAETDVPLIDEAFGKQDAPAGLGLKKQPAVSSEEPRIPVANDSEPTPREIKPYPEVKLNLGDSNPQIEKAREIPQVENYNLIQPQEQQATEPIQTSRLIEVRSSSIAIEKKFERTSSAANINPEVNARPVFVDRAVLDKVVEPSVQPAADLAQPNIEIPTIENLRIERVEYSSAEPDPLEESLELNHVGDEISSISEVVRQSDTEQQIPVDVVSGDALTVDLDPGFQQSTTDDAPAQNFAAAIATERIVKPFASSQMPFLDTTQFAEQGPQIVKQVTTQVSESIAESPNAASRSVSLQLQPEELGQLTIHIRQTAEAVSAQIITTEHMATDLLQNQKELLVDALADLGFEDANVDISHRKDDRAGSQQQSNWQQSKSRQGKSSSYNTQDESESPIKQPATNTQGLSILA